MIKVNTGGLNGRQRILNAFTFLCLFCSLVSICFLFTSSRVSTGLSKIYGNNHLFNPLSSPLLLQTDCEDNSESNPEVNRQKKNSFTGPSAAHPGIKHYIAGKNAYLSMLQSFNVNFTDNGKSAFLLLDLPPPPV